MIDPQENQLAANPPPAIELSVRYPKGQAPKFKKLTLGKVGTYLPLGIPSGAGRVHDFEFLPFMLDEEIELTNVREGLKDASVGAVVDATLCALLKRIGSMDFASMSLADKKLVLAGMYLPDVLYTYVALRRETMGTVLPLTLRCGVRACKWESDFEGNIDTLDVKVLEEPAPRDLAWYVDLSPDGFMFRGKKYEGVWLQPARWSSMNSGLGTAPTPGERKLAFLRASLYDLEPSVRVGDNGGSPLVLPDDALRKGLSKFAYEKISASIEANVSGALFVIKQECPRCGSKIFVQVDWVSESFFKCSPPSQPGAEESSTSDSST